jgi:hypothetical protein
MAPIKSTIKTPTTKPVKPLTKAEEAKKNALQKQADAFKKQQITKLNEKVKPLIQLTPPPTGSSYFVNAQGLDKHGKPTVKADKEKFYNFELPDSDKVLSATSEIFEDKKTGKFKKETRIFSETIDDKGNYIADAHFKVYTQEVDANGKPKGEAVLTWKENPEFTPTEEITSVPATTTTKITIEVPSTTVKSTTFGTPLSDKWLAG